MKKLLRRFWCGLWYGHDWKGDSEYFFADFYIRECRCSRCGKFRAIWANRQLVEAKMRGDR